MSPETQRLIPSSLGREAVLTQISIFTEPLTKQRLAWRYPGLPLQVSTQDVCYHQNHQGEEVWFEQEMAPQAQVFWYRVPSY